MILYSENSVLKMRSSLTTTPRPSNGNDALLLVFLSLARVILQLGTTSGSKMARLTFSRLFLLRYFVSGLPVAVFILQATSSMSVKLPQTTQMTL